MKKILALLLCCAMLFLISCGIAQDPAEPLQSGETAAPQAPAEEEIAELPPEEAVPERPVLTVRENPSSGRTMDNITPFAQATGTVISRDSAQEFPGAFADLNRLIIETERITHVPEMKTYFVDGYCEKAEKLLDVIESTTGLSFSDGKIQLMLGDAGNRQSDFDYVSCGVDAQARIVQICQGDGFMGNGYELISFLAFVLQWDQAPQPFNDILSSGFATYMTYDVLSQLEVNDPDFATAFAGSQRVCDNYYIHDPEVLCGTPMAVWMTNGYPYSMTNGSSAVGFWLMKYLDDVYGDYTKWLTAYNAGSGTLDVDGQIQLLKDAYGDAVLDEFYPWVQENLAKFVPWEMIPDRTGIQEYVCYPFLTGMDLPQEILNGDYSDICIALTQYRHYLTQVKEFTIDALTLIKFTDAEVVLYSEDGTFLQATKGTLAEDGSYLVSLDEAFFVRFPDPGYQCAQLDLAYTAP